MMFKHARQTPIVLVIDDDPFMREMALAALEETSIQVEQASDGTTGLAAIARLTPDLVLLDVMMPYMNGFDVCRALRKLPRCVLPPVFMLTGLDDIDSINQAYEAGATDFITKPINWTILRHRLRYMLNASKSLEKLAISESKLANAQRLSAVGNWDWDVANNKVNWSDEMYRIFDIPPAQFNKTIEAFLQQVHPEDRSQVQAAMQATRTLGTPCNIDHRILRANGIERYVQCQAEALTDPNDKGVQPIILYGTLQDITERKRHEAQISRLANFDALTELPNRNLLNDRVTQSIALANRSEQQLAMLCIGLDGFKFINDSFGHAVGDLLLQMVAARLQASVREGDTVARLSGDEFIVLLLGLAHSGVAGTMAQKILDTFAYPFLVDGQPLHITASIGVSVFPDDGDVSDALLKNADTAMYSAKQKSRDCIQFYAREMSFHAEQRVAMESALRLAVERREFEVYYQPKVNLRSGKVAGVEALVRWNRPGVEMVPPDRFVPLAEETGLIVAIGEWVLKTACAQTVQWHAMGYTHLSVAVNLSARQFVHQNVPNQVKQILAETGLAAKYLELELTESILMHNTDAMAAVLLELKALGLMLTLDDFGTGYSSLSYLKRFPIDVLKIDRSFIQNVTTDADDASLTKTIILMAQSLKMKTVAEGVETEGQLGFLKANQCDEIQGFYFSQPLTAAALTEILQQGKQLAPDNDSGHQQQTLLLVDDEMNILNSLYRLFRQDGYQILRASSPAEGFELLALHKVQLIISDQRMPSMTGTEFLSKVKTMYPETIRIILSGYTELASVIDAINHGAVYRFFTKPWDDRVLRDNVREAFHHHWLIHGATPASAPPRLGDQTE